MAQLDEMLAQAGRRLDRAVEFRINDNLLVRRITGRLVHQPSGRVYHAEFNPPKVPMKDDVTGEPLIQRDDDNPATLVKRLEVYHQQTKPLLDYYGGQGKLYIVDASKPPSTVWESVRGLFFML